MGESTVVHWRKRLKNGDVRFFIKTGHNKTEGTVSDDDFADFCAEAHERVYGVTLPEPTWR